MKALILTLPAMKALILTLLAFILTLTLRAQPLTGWVDMHAHPRGDLAYGRELFYGTPYGNIDTALGNCKSHHSAWGFGNPHGNLFRSVVAAQTEQQMHAPWRDGKEGYPDFKTWPSWCSILHQQMWIDWIRRAHEEGGLTIMCALAVSSHCIASAAQTEGPQDDKQVTRDLIQGIKDMVASSDFMEIAYTPEDARRIAASGKLIVVLGSEMDNIGNFYNPQDKYPRTFIPEPTEAQVKAELDSLWDMGIRYIFPVHLNNTPFGGTALAMSQLNVANKFVTGAEYQPEEVSTAETGIAFRLEHPGNSLNAMAKMAMPALMPKTVNPGRKENYTAYDSIPGKGQRNSLGITPLGRFAIGYMMDLGMMIDIDHMSEKMANAVLDMAVERDYPVNSGHSGPRGTAGSEGDRTPAQYAKLKQVGGMVGLGHNAKASKFVETFRQVYPLLDDGHIAMGTDVGGFSPLPPPDTSVTVKYDAAFQPCKTGNRTWDINVDGVAHYGLWPDYIRAWDAAGMQPQEKAAFLRSAEGFLLMWAKCRDHTMPRQ